MIRRITQVLFFFLGALLIGHHCQASDRNLTPTGLQGIDADNALVIDGIINRNLGPLEERLAKAENDSALDIVINSPGGSVDTGFAFISKMDAARSRGVHIRCVVVDMAASMAFGILVHCDERYALDHAMLLWHRARTSVGGMFGGGTITAPSAEVLARQLQILDSLILKEVQDAMPEADQKLLEWHFENETLHTGVELHQFCPSFIVPIASLSGLYEALASKKATRSTILGLGFLRLRPGQFVYIAPGFSVVN